MKKLLLTLVLGFVVSTFLFAQVKPNADLVAGTKVEKSRGVDANIVSEKRVNGVESKSKVVQPTNKGAEQSRGGYCYITFDNWTNYYIDCYVDGYNEGYVAPYGSGDVTVSGGDTKLYAVATFDDGSKITWGPQTRYCNNQEWEWTMSN